MFALFLVSVVLGLSEGGLPLYTVPSTELSWGPASGQDLTCSSYETPDNCDLSYSTAGQKIRDDVHHVMKVNGVECRVWVLIRKTSENFWGNTHTWTEDEPADPTVEECKEALQEPSQKYYRAIDSGEYPPCGGKWLKTRTCRIRRVKLSRDFDVTYDPYHDDYKSELFPGGQCSSSECATIHSTVLWFLLTPHSKTCNIFEVVNLSVFRSEGNICGVKDATHGFHPFKNPCTLNFCGSQGTLLADGTWYGKVSLGSNPPCDSTRSPVTHNLAENLAHEELTLLEIIDLRACEEAKARYKSTSKIVIQDLEYFRRKVEGRGFIFRLNEGVLEKSTTFYKGINDWNKIDFNNQTLVTLKTHAERVTSGNTVNFYNGIILEHGRVIIPRKAILDQEYSQGLLSEESIEWEHPVLRIKSNTTKEEGVNSVDDEDQEGGGFMIPSLSLGVNLAILLIPVGIILGLIICLCCCCQLGWCCFKPKVEGVSKIYQPVPIRDWETSFSAPGSP